ncbi:hypothetical protein OPT61_g5450 [Boeremia exigua]|uniref:Uncharacterized protein n=1 Tax=Boeremia exigua TaxID=749465 RepID=A0ACC2IAH4_9PLEO|nr:hypothetical protein OPT61_g5450 [Boeremia exigua]
MANSQATPASYTIPVTSYETALCILPPVEQCEHIDSLREVYDKSYGKWPAHINLVYPFVAPEHLPRAQQQIQAQFQRNLDSASTRQAKLGLAGLFRQRHNSTAILQESQESSNGCLELLRSLALKALGHGPKPHNFHLSVGQTEDNSMSSLEFLIAKVRLLPTLSFNVDSVAILIRERTPGQQPADRMRLWGSIDIGVAPAVSPVSNPEYWLLQYPIDDVNDMQEEDEQELPGTTLTFSRAVQPGKTFSFDPISGNWIIARELDGGFKDSRLLTVSTYNVLVDSEFPPARDRDSLLISTLLSAPASADIAVLQEVSDDFLSVLLSDPGIQAQYPFSSHGPPCQPDIGPLPSLRNVVVISRWPFRWDLVPFHRRHKGAVVAFFDSLSSRRALVVAGVHLTCGLTDGSVAAKKVQVQSLLSHLNRKHSGIPWIITGDFNLATSTHTIENALKSKSITSQTRSTLAAIEDRLSADGLLDSWVVARDQQFSDTNDDETDDLFEGEEGATFDPRNNSLAATTSGTSQNRPQRYDRILVRPLDTFRVKGFNMFGNSTDAIDSSPIPSDHYGIRASIQFLRVAEQMSADQDELLRSLKLEAQYRPHLTSLDLESTLRRNSMFLTHEERARRKAAFVLLQEVVLACSSASSSRVAGVPLVMVPVGSFAMRVDTPESDIDCLCIGSISSKTFFKLARQRLQKAENQGVRLLRKVEASTGTMLELSVNGLAMDLQYCPASRIAERWSEFDELPASDPIFNLPILSLRKLKPYRDLQYIKHTIPDHITFDQAYRAIKLWAIQRGVYSSKFGYLGGVHITIMLSWIHKRMAYDVSASNFDPHPIRASDLVATFFHYYAGFEWADAMVFDAFFHKSQPRYHRTTREPMVVLGAFPPNSNVAHTSTLPGLLTLSKEFKDADLRLQDPCTTWQGFFNPSDVQNSVGMGVGQTEFLQTYKNYLSIDIQFWGRTLAKGKSLVGWVESRCLSLVVDIHKIFPGIEVRLWPARFTDSKPDELMESVEYHGCYLIGLQRINNASLTPSNREERQIARQSLDKVIDRFLTQLRTDEKNYDGGTSWVNASLTTQRGVQTRELRLDEREWGDYAVDAESDSDEEEEPDDIDGEDAEPSKPLMRVKPSPSLTPVATAKLRPASDVLNRLRWDPNLDPANYIIGYEDRFLGAKEISLEKWKTEQTDEEFIPQHRVLYFRKKFNNEGDGKGEVVWERATRIDHVFGSGASAGV